MGRSGVGKTTLMEQAVRALEARGVAVLAVKSSHHRLADAPGSDSHRLSAAGAGGVAFLTPNGIQLFLDPPPSLGELLPLLAPRYQIALVEGGKSSPYPKVELVANLPPLLSEGEVVAYLQRGAQPDSPEPLQDLLELIELHGQPIAG